MKRAIMILVVACSAHPTAAPDATNTCTGLAESDCNARPDCYALYTAEAETNPPGGGVFDSCSAGSATCKLGTGCAFGGTGCPQGFSLDFVIPDGNCQDGFSIPGCVQADKCPP